MLPTLKALFAKGQKVEIKKGTILIAPETQVKDIFFIKKGYVMMYQQVKDGQKVHAYIKPGELFPVLASISTRKNDLYFEALTDLDVLTISKKTFLHAINHDLSLSKEVMALLARYLSLYVERVSNLEIPTARERIATRLHFFINRYGKKTDEGIIFDIPITHQMLADSLNLTRETVTRELNKLEHEGIIAFSGRKMLIKNDSHLLKIMHAPVF